jgi:type IV secretory pathway VirB2 component (pilin)
MVAISRCRFIRGERGYPVKKTIIVAGIVVAGIAAVAGVMLTRHTTHEAI